MSKKQEISKLIDSSNNSIDIKNSLNEILNNLCTKDINESTAIELFSELADRQWHLYERICSDSLALIEDKIFEIVNPDSTHDIDYVGLIAGMLGSVRLFDFLVKLSQRENLPNDIRLLLIESINDLQPNISDPYAIFWKIP